MSKVIVGLDMSLTSAGIAIFYQETKTWQLYAFAQRQKEIGMKKKLNEFVSLTLFGRIPTSDCSSDAVRYQFIIEHIIKIIPSNAIVLIEAYAYPNKAIAGSNFKLHELGGVLKVELLKKNIQFVYSIVSSSWRKLAFGKGNLNKNDVVELILKNDPFIDLMQTFDLKLSKNGTIPCPVQDIADAIGIVKSYDQFMLQSYKKEPKQKKIKLSLTSLEN